MVKPTFELSQAQKQDAKRYFAGMLVQATNQVRQADGPGVDRDEVRKLITKGIKTYGGSVELLMMEEIIDFVLRYSKHAAAPNESDQEGQLLLTDCTSLYGDTFGGRFTHLKTSYLHHYSDGREEYFPLMPLLMRCYTVELWRGENWKFIEITRTYNVFEEAADGHSSTSIPPRGDGWKVFDRRNDGWTGWWRPANPDGMV